MYLKNVLLLSSLFSLIISSVLGLTQSRIKRLFAYSTISHVGFILLALSINSAESIQAYIFYILQYSLSNLNAFIILITIGFTFYLHVSKEKESKELIDENNSPVQLINQIKGYFYINPLLGPTPSISSSSSASSSPLVPLSPPGSGTIPDSPRLIQDSSDISSDMEPLDILDDS